VLEFSYFRVNFSCRSFSNVPPSPPQSWWSVPVLPPRDFILDASLFRSRFLIFRSSFGHHAPIRLSPGPHLLFIEIHLSHLRGPTFVFTFFLFSTFGSDSLRLSPSLVPVSTSFPSFPHTTAFRDYEHGCVAPASPSTSHVVSPHLSSTFVILARPLLLLATLCYSRNCAGSCCSFRLPPPSLLCRNCPLSLDSSPHKRSARLPSMRIFPVPGLAAGWQRPPRSFRFLALLLMFYFFLVFLDFRVLGCAPFFVPPPLRFYFVCVGVLPQPRSSRALSFSGSPLFSSWLYVPICCFFGGPPQNPLAFSHSAKRFVFFFFHLPISYSSLDEEGLLFSRPFFPLGAAKSDSFILSCSPVFFVNSLQLPVLSPSSFKLT